MMHSIDVGQFAARYLTAPIPRPQGSMGPRPAQLAALYLAYVDLR